MPVWTVRGTDPSYQDAEWSTFDGSQFADDGTVAGTVQYDKRTAPTIYIVADLRNPPADFPVGPAGDYYNNITAIQFAYRFAHTGYGDDTFTMQIGGSMGIFGPAKDSVNVWGNAVDDITGDLGSGGGGPTTVTMVPTTQAPTAVESTFNAQWEAAMAGTRFFGMGYTASHSANMASDGPITVSTYSLEFQITYNSWTPPPEDHQGTGNIEYATTLSGTGVGTIPSPLVETLTDDFSGTLIQWPGAYGGATISGERAQIPCTTGYPGILTQPDVYQLTGSSIFAELELPPVGAGSRESFMELLLDASNKISMFVSGSDITARTVTGGGNTDHNTITYDPAQHRWWRIRESGGTLTFEVAPDGTGSTYSELASVAVPAWSLDSLEVSFTSGYWGTEDAANAFIDNVNVLGAPPPAETGTGNIAYSTALAGTGYQPQQESGTGATSYATTLSGAGVGSESASGTGTDIPYSTSLSGTGSGVEAGNGTGDAAYSTVLAGTGTAIVKYSGTGNIDVSLSVDGAGSMGATGQGDALYSSALAGTGTGSESSSGTGAITYSTAVSAVGNGGEPGQGQGNILVGFAVAGTGVGTEAPSGTGGLSYSVALSGTGVATEVATGTGSISYGTALAGTGSPMEAPSGTGAIEFSTELVATGVEILPPGFEGSGAIPYSVELAGVGVALETPTGTGAISYSNALDADRFIRAEGTGDIAYSVELAGVSAYLPIPVYFWNGEEATKAEVYYWDGTTAHAAASLYRESQ